MSKRSLALIIIAIIICMPWELFAEYNNVSTTSATKIISAPIVYVGSDIITTAQQEAQIPTIVVDASYVELKIKLSKDFGDIVKITSTHYYEAAHGLCEDTKTQEVQRGDDGYFHIIAKREAVFSDEVIRFNIIRGETVFSFQTKLLLNGIIDSKMPSQITKKLSADELIEHYAINANLSQEEATLELQSVILDEIGEDYRVISTDYAVTDEYIVTMNLYCRISYDNHSLEVSKIYAAYLDCDTNDKENDMSFVGVYDMWFRDESMLFHIINGYLIDSSGQNPASAQNLNVAVLEEFQIVYDGQVQVDNAIELYVDDVISLRPLP